MKKHYGQVIAGDECDHILASCQYKTWTKGNMPIRAYWGTDNNFETLDGVTCKRCLGMAKTDFRTLDSW